MAKALQRRRGTTEEHKSFTGLEGEFTYDTTEKRIVVHDGVTKGGIPMAKKEEVEQVANSLDPRILDAASQSDILEAVSQATVGNVNDPAVDTLAKAVANVEVNISNVIQMVSGLGWTVSGGANGWARDNKSGFTIQWGAITQKVFTYPRTFVTCYGALAISTTTNAYWSRPVFPHAPTITNTSATFMAMLTTPEQANAWGEETFDGTGFAWGIS